jgi:RNase adaptor protein for sRNA GlmZ degradation
LNKRLGLEKGSKLTLSILSFGFRNGLPNEADTIIDVRFLSNPHYNDELRPLDGRDKKIANFIENDPRFSIFIDGFENFLDPCHLMVEAHHYNGDWIENEHQLRCRPHLAARFENQMIKYLE